MPVGFHRGIAGLFLVLSAVAGSSPRAGATVAPYKLLILGDSYSSGNGSRGLVSDPEECWRSSTTWGELLSDPIASRVGRPVEVTNRACSGSVTRDILEPHTLSVKSFEFNIFFADSKSVADSKSDDFCRDRPVSSSDQYQSGTAGSWILKDSYFPICRRMLRPQVWNVTADYDLVVFTIGGNDGGFANIARRCLAIPGPAPLQLVISLRDGPMCRDALDKTQDLVQRNNGRELRTRLKDVNQAIQERLNPPTRSVPGRVMLLSYPYLSVNDYSFEGIEVSKRLLDLGDRTDSIQREVMSLFNPASPQVCAAHRSIFADGTKHEFSGHTLRAPVNIREQTESWIWEIVTTQIDDSFHPKPNGHSAESRAALDALDASGLSGCAPSSTFVLNRADNGVEGANLETSLAALGDVVERAQALPGGDLTRFRAVWVVIAYEGLTPDEAVQLTNYVERGGHLYLTGERPCCEHLNSVNEVIINGVLRDPGVQVGGLGDIHGPFLPNPVAAGSISLSPARLTEFAPDAPGGMAGIGNVDSRNVFISNGSVPVAAVWDESDMRTSTGRIVILMDIDWLKVPNRSQYVINVHDFLSKQGA